MTAAGLSDAVAVLETGRGGIVCVRSFAAIRWPVTVEVGMSAGWCLQLGGAAP
jgi:hypothetical protein